MSFSIRAKLLAVVAAAMNMATFAMPAQALDLDLLPSADPGPTSWAGWIINPDIGFESMSFSGTGGNLLGEADGFYAGGYAGRDFQWGPLVVGASANIAYSWMEGSGAGTDPFDLQTRLNYFGLVRGRAGVGLGRFLIYGTAGLAYGDLEIESRATAQSASETLTGFATGGGIEIAWNGSMSLKAEYLTIDFDAVTFSSLPAGRDVVDAEMELWKIGFVRRF
jgi:outer membrane immunogenic protein